MGIGFVLIIWAFILLVLGAFGALGLSFITYRISRSSTLTVRWTRTLGAFAYPFIMIGYLGFSFLLYALWCEGYRKVDCGLGDCWHVPLQNGYQLVFIDVPEKGSISKDFDTGLFEDTISEITQIGIKGDLVYGFSNDSGYFLFDTKDQKLKTTRIKEEWKTWLVRSGLSGSEELTKTFDFYIKIRTTTADSIAFGAMVLVGFLISALWWFCIWKVPSWVTFLSKLVPLRIKNLVIGERK